ncbi:MAG: hypothetical protein HUK22_00800, partial [Thermoguttaceae bacterium]|nr:hypothetical protein [Thermoguttaceae bacterium]
MTFALKLLVSRARRQKSRLALVALAIAASSCLIVWTIGGYQALFIDATINEANYLGRYDLVAAPEIGGSASGGGPSFGGPFARATKEEKPAQTPAKPKRGGGKRGASRGIPTSLADALRADPDVAFCDATGTVRAFVYAPGMERSILEDPDADDEGAKPTVKRSLEIPDDETPVAPEGIDPELHRRAFAAYRATMGTPTGLGSDFLVADAEEPPFELKIGRWLAPGAAR